MGEVRIEYMDLEQLKAWPRNPKAHERGLIQTSIGRFGFVDPIVLDERSGCIASGHGRVEALREMKEAGQSPPDRVVISASGDWSVPVVRGVSFKDEDSLARYAVAANRLVELGGWDDDVLVQVLERITDDSGLDGTGYAEDDVTALRAVLDAREKLQAKRLLEGKVVFLFAVEDEPKVRTFLEGLKHTVPGLSYKEDVTTS